LPPFSGYIIKGIGSHRYVGTYQTTKCHIKKDCNPHGHSHKNLRSLSSHYRMFLLEVRCTLMTDSLTRSCAQSLCFLLYLLQTGGLRGETTPKIFGTISRRELFSECEIRKEGYSQTNAHIQDIVNLRFT
jgi:hypothetical protein